MQDEGIRAGPGQGQGQVELPPWPDLVRHEVGLDSEHLGRRSDAPSLSPETAEGPHDRHGGTCRSLRWGPGCQEERCVARGRPSEVRALSRPRPGAGREAAGARGHGQVRPGPEGMRATGLGTSQMPHRPPLSPLPNGSAPYLPSMTLLARRLGPLSPCPAPCFRSPWPRGLQGKDQHRVPPPLPPRALLLPAQSL